MTGVQTCALPIFAIGTGFFPARGYKLKIFAPKCTEFEKKLLTLQDQVVTFISNDMKTPKGIRPQNLSDELRQARRLEPNRRSGKERRALYGTIADEEEDEADSYLRSRSRGESALDYLDDGED